jgi:hypothetical protein
MLLYLYSLIVESERGYLILIIRQRLFTITNKRIGTGNNNVILGDPIYNIAGLNMLFIVCEKGAYYELISPTLVIRAMHREMWPEDENEIVPWEII